MKHCTICHDPATTAVEADGIQGLLCDNCTSDIRTEFANATLTTL